jgi:hypothetical protein
MADNPILPPPRPVSHDEAIALGIAAALAVIHTIVRRP